MPCITASTNGYIEAPQISFRDNCLIITTQNDANVYFTFGGSDPKINDVLYKNPLRIETIHTDVRAIAIKDGVVSEEAVAVYSTDDKFELSKPSIFGGKGYDNFTNIEKDGEHYIVVGDCAEDSFGNGDLFDLEAKDTTDAMIIKYDKTGEMIWKRNFGGYSDDYFVSVAVDETGYVAVGNNYDSDGGDWETFSMGWLDAIIVKYDKQWNLNTVKKWCQYHKSRK
jgi:hypothetical protein